LSFKSGSEMAT
jgi:hypothetical protein